jgi:hypothetical protein
MALAFFLFAGAIFLATVSSGTAFRFVGRFCAGCCDILTSLFFDLVEFVLVFHYEA